MGVEVYEHYSLKKQKQKNLTFKKGENDEKESG